MEDGEIYASCKNCHWKLTSPTVTEVVQLHKNTKLEDTIEDNIAPIDVIKSYADKHEDSADHSVKITEEYLYESL